MVIWELVHSFKLVKDHYSFLAPIYNSLTKLVFGDQLMLAKTCFVDQLATKKILIIGGGDGKDYKPLQEDLHGEYWELSSAMLQLAQHHLGKSQLVYYLGEYHFSAGKFFDEVWLHFVLDTMTDEEIGSLMNQIRASLKTGGRVYLVDFFEPKSTWQIFLNWSMISFFRLVANHKRKNLPDYVQILESANWKKVGRKEFLEGWVKSQLWE